MATILLLDYILSKVLPTQLYLIKGIALHYFSVLKCPPLLFDSIIFDPIYRVPNYILSKVLSATILW